MSLNLVRIGCKTHILHYLIRDCYVSILRKSSIHPTTSNNISINSQFGWIYIWVLELIGCNCDYF